ncbi:MAG: hypothetical protein SGJ10_09235 [Bacteroidota bacterium]|nr:hypothetical protein [Bacteroidota bacterium]
MKKITIICLLFTAFCKGAWAQVPGFIGKKFSASAGLMFFPAFNATYNNRENILPILGGEISFFGMNWIKNLNLDYAKSRTTTVGLDYQNMRTSDFVVPSTSSSNHKAIRYVHANSVGVNFKIFNEDKGALAPIGNFQKLGLNMLLTRSYDSLDNILKAYPTKNHFLTFTYGFGKRIILYKYFTFTYGVDMTIMLDQSFVTPIDGNDIRRYYDAGFVRTRSMKLINAHASIGYVF